MTDEIGGPEFRANPLFSFTRVPDETPDGTLYLRLVRDEGRVKATLNHGDLDEVTALAFASSLANLSRVLSDEHNPFVSGQSLMDFAKFLTNDAAERRRSVRQELEG